MNGVQKADLVRFAKLKDLTVGGKSDIGTTLERMARLLEDSGIVGTIQVQVVEEGQPHRCAIQLDKTQSKLLAGGVSKPDLEVIMQRQFLQMA